jgi:hypothetical protein
LFWRRAIFANGNSILGAWSLELGDRLKGEKNLYGESFARSGELWEFSLETLIWFCVFFIFLEILKEIVCFFTRLTGDLAQVTLGSWSLFRIQEKGN